MDVIAQLGQDSAVADVEANRLRYMSKDPNDEGFYDEGHLFVSRLPIAWEITEGSSNLDIAILDTGVDLDHPDLDGRIVVGYDAINNDSSAMDDEGHGTMVAGIAAVGATDFEGEAAAFTNFGPWVDLTAPGVQIVSTRWGPARIMRSGTAHRSRPP